MNILAGAAGKRIARDLFTEEWAVEQIEAAGVIYLDWDRKGFRTTLRSGLKHGKSKPWTPDRAEEYLREKGEREAAQAGFGQAALPEGATLVPLPPPATQGDLTLTPEERMIANLGTQHAIALIFADRMEGNMLYDHTRKAWLEYDGTRWAVDDRK